MEMEPPQDAPGQRRLFYVLAPFHPFLHPFKYVTIPFFFRSLTSPGVSCFSHSLHALDIFFSLSLYRTWKDNVSEGWRTPSWSGICSSGDTWLWPSSVHFINRTAPNRILRFSWNLKKRAVECVQAQCGKLKKSRDGALTDNCLQAKVQAIKTRRAVLSSMS